VNAVSVHSEGLQATLKFPFENLLAGFDITAS